jgi:hypothetical protein
LWAIFVKSPVQREAAGKSISHSMLATNPIPICVSARISNEDAGKGVAKSDSYLRFDFRIPAAIRH